MYYTYFLRQLYRYCIPRDRLLERINQLIADASSDKNAYIQLVNGTQQNGLMAHANNVTKDETINVQITPKNCMT
jgi:hypothetical protein